MIFESYWNKLNLYHISWHSEMCVLEKMLKERKMIKKKMIKMEVKFFFFFLHTYIHTSVLIIIYTSIILLQRYFTYLLEDIVDNYLCHRQLINVYKSFIILKKKPN